MQRGATFRLLASEAAHKAKDAQSPREVLELLQCVAFWVTAAENEEWLHANSLHRHEVMRRPRD